MLKILFFYLISEFGHGGTAILRGWYHCPLRWFASVCRFRLVLIDFGRFYTYPYEKTRYEVSVDKKKQIMKTSQWWGFRVRLLRQLTFTTEIFFFGQAVKNKTVNTTVEKSHETKNEKEFIGEGCRFCPWRLRQALPTIFSLLAVRFALI